MRWCLLFLSVYFLSCKPANKGSIERAWMYHNDLSDEKQPDAVYKHGDMEYGFSSASFLDLQPTGKFTSYFSAFDYGEWKFEDSILILTNHNKGRLLLHVKELNDKMICINKSNQKVYPFDGFNNVFSSEADNPFSIMNNRWRVKAGHKETDAELVARLKNHFRWWEKYFKWALNNEMKSLDIRSTASVLDMYANGFELQYFDTQLPAWQNLFYDSADCWRAYEMVYYLMYKKDINWPKTENGFESFVSAFRQLQQWMDLDPATYLPAANKIKGSEAIRSRSGKKKKASQ